jgi:subfamily B ATP-binding cassette protein MsbA
MRNLILKVDFMSNRLLNLTNSIGSRNNLATPLSEFLGITTIAVYFFYGGNLVLVEKTLDGSAFIVYLTLALIFSPLQKPSLKPHSVKWVTLQIVFLKF